MKNVHKLAVIFAVLTLTAALLTGCQVTSPNDPEFRKDWDESMDEMQKERDEAMEEAAKDWDAWKQEHKNGWTIEDGKDHYWKILDGEDKEIGTVQDEAQVKALDGVLSDDGSWGLEETEDPGEAAFRVGGCGDHEDSGRPAVFYGGGPGRISDLFHQRSGGDSGDSAESGTVYRVGGGGDESYYLLCPAAGLGSDSLRRRGL